MNCLGCRPAACWQIMNVRLSLQLEAALLQERGDCKKLTEEAAVAACKMDTHLDTIRKMQVFHACANAASRVASVRANAYVHHSPSHAHTLTHQAAERRADRAEELHDLLLLRRTMLRFAQGVGVQRRMQRINAAAARLGDRSCMVSVVHVYTCVCVCGMCMCVCVCICLPTVTIAS